MIVRSTESGFTMATCTPALVFEHGNSHGEGVRGLCANGEECRATCGLVRHDHAGAVAAARLVGADGVIGEHRPSLSRQCFPAIAVEAAGTVIGTESATTTNTRWASCVKTVAGAEQSAVPQRDDDGTAKNGAHGG